MKVHARKDSTSALKISIAANYASLALPIIDWDATSAKSLGVMGQKYNVVLEHPKGQIGGGDAVLRYIGRSRPDMELYGETIFQAAEVDMWLQFSSELENSFFPLAPSTVNESSVAYYLEELNTHFLSNTYTVGHVVTLADIALAVVLHQSQVINSQGNAALKKYPNISRWFSTVTGQKPFVKVLNTQEKQAVEKPAKDAKAPEKAKAETADEDEKPVELPIMDKWKKFYSNSKDRKGEAIPWFYNEFDLAKGFSVWHMRYNKLPDECKLDFVTANLLAGFMQRVDNSMRGESFGVLHVLGEKGVFDIEGVWLFSGQEIPELMKGHPSFEYHDFTKLNAKDDKDAALISAFWCEQDKINGRPIVATHPWK